MQVLALKRPIIENPEQKPNQEALVFVSAL